MAGHAETHEVVQLQPFVPLVAHRLDVMHSVREHNSPPLQTILTKVVIAYAGGLTCSFPSRAGIEPGQLLIASRFVVSSIMLGLLSLCPNRVCFTVSLTCEFDTTRDYTRA